MNATVQVAVEASVNRLMKGLMPMIAANINTGGGATTGNGGFGPGGKIFRDIRKFGNEGGQSGRSSSRPQSKNTMRGFSMLWRWRVIQRLRPT